MERLAKNISFGRTYASGPRWRTVVYFEIGPVWISGSIFDDGTSACFFWPAMMRGRGAPGHRKLAGCIDISLRDRVEKDLLEEYQNWRLNEPLPQIDRVDMVTFPDKLTMGEFVGAVLRGASFMELMPHLGPRNYIRAVRILTAIYGEKWGDLNGVHPRDYPLLFAIVGQMHVYVRLSKDNQTAENPNL